MFSRTGSYFGYKSYQLAHLRPKIYIQEVMSKTTLNHVYETRKSTFQIFGIQTLTLYSTI